MRHNSANQHIATAKAALSSVCFFSLFKTRLLNTFNDPALLAVFYPKFVTN